MAPKPPELSPATARKPVPRVRYRWSTSGTARPTSQSSTRSPRRLLPHSASLSAWPLPSGITASTGGSSPVEISWSSTWGSWAPSPIH